jgi:hypothetical protein
VACRNIINCGGQTEQDDVAKGCGTRVRDEKEVAECERECECERWLKTPGLYFQDNIKVNLKYYVLFWTELVSFRAGCIRGLLQTG